MKNLVVQRCVILLCILAASCFKADDYSEDGCDEAGALDGQTFESDAGEGTFSFRIYGLCNLPGFITYKNGTSTVNLFETKAGKPGYVAYAPNGDVWAWNDDTMRLVHLHENFWEDKTDILSEEFLISAHFTQNGTGYFLLSNSVDSHDQGLSLLKYSDGTAHEISMPDSPGWKDYSFSSFGEILVLYHADDEPPARLAVLREDTWEEGPSPIAPGEEYLKGIRIVGENEFWMWTRNRRDSDGGPYEFYTYKDGAWTPFHTANFHVRNVITDDGIHRLIYGDTGFQSELGDWVKGHGVFEFFDGLRWETQTFHDRLASLDLSRISFDSSGNLWVSASMFWWEREEECLDVEYSRPLFMKYDGLRWIEAEIPESLGRLMVNDTGSDNACAGEPAD